MSVEAILDSMVDFNFPVVEYRGVSPEKDKRGLRLGPFGMEISTNELPPGRFAWMGFDLPSGRHVKALAEVVGVLAGDLEESRVVMRFKHIFPADRSILNDFFLNSLAA